MSSQSIKDVLKMATQDFINELELEFYIQNNIERNLLANFLVGLASQKVQKKLVIFYGVGCNGKTFLWNKIKKLFHKQSETDWYDDPSLDFFDFMYSAQDYCTASLLNTYDTKNLKNIKQLLGPDAICYRDNSTDLLCYTDIPTCNILLQTNTLSVNSLMARATIINFTYNIPNQLLKIEEEIDNILNNFLLQDIIHIIHTYYGQ